MRNKTEFLNVLHIEAFNNHSNIITMVSGTQYQMDESDFNRIYRLLITLIR